jgi:mevalonate kinase
MSFERIPALPPLNILLTNSCVSRSTKVLVAGVKGLKERFPSVVDPILDSIENISQTFLKTCISR